MRKIKQYYNRGPVGVPLTGTPERAALDLFREMTEQPVVKSLPRKAKNKKRKARLGRKG